MTFLITDNNELNIVIKHNDKEYCTLYGEDESKNPCTMDDDTANLIVDNKDYIKYCVNAILDRYDYFAYKDAVITNKEKTMTLTEAINHCREVADRNCGKCADDHRQLAKWLEELKKLRYTRRKEKTENTNADIIRRMSNAELAELIVPKVMFCNGCPVKCAENDIPMRTTPFGENEVENVCLKRVETWLNRENKNGKIERYLD